VDELEVMSKVQRLHRCTSGESSAELGCRSPVVVYHQRTQMMGGVCTLSLSTRHLKLVVRVQMCLLLGTVSAYSRGTWVRQGLCLQCSGARSSVMIDIGLICWLLTMLGCTWPAEMRIDACWCQALLSQSIISYHSRIDVSLHILLT
jgi:hypothetical protein